MIDPEHRSVYKISHSDIDFSSSLCTEVDTRTYLEIDENWNIEEEREEGDWDEIETEMFPRGCGPDVDAVLVRVADGEMPLEGEGHNG